MDRTHLAEDEADNSAPVLLTLLQKKRTIQTQQILDFLESEAADISDSELSRCRYYFNYVRRDFYLRLE